MKILVNSQQFKYIVNESLNDEYTEKLLDKISTEGLNSLNDDEKDSLNKTNFIPNEDETEENEPDSSDNNNDPYYIDNPIHKSFMNLFPNKVRTDFENKPYEIMVTNGNNNEVLKVSDSDSDMTIHPFFDGNKMIGCKNGNTSSLTIEKIPQNDDEMKSFINSFLSKMLPVLITNLNKNIQ